MIKKIECTFREERLETALEALRMAGVPGVTVIRVEGFGAQRVTTEPVLKSKVRVEIYLPDEDVETIVEVLTLSVRSNQMGDGKIAVLDVDNLVRIRTGEQYREALY